MTSLSQLNESAASPIEVTDARPAGVIFDRLEPREDSFTITTLNRPLVPTFEISEIINYSTANVRYRLTINSTRSQFITNSSLTFATMPAGVSVATVTTTYAKQYTVTGFNSAAIWQKIKTPTWNIHSDFGLATIFYVLAEIIYYDAATSQDVSREWFIFDPRYYYVARLLPQFAVSAIIGNKKPFSAAITASFSFFTDAPFTYKRFVMGTTVNAFVTANVRKAKQLNANLSSPVATFTATGNKTMRGNGAFAIQSSVVCLNTRVLAPMSQITLFVVAGRIGPGSATFIEGNGLPYYDYDGTLLNIGGLPPGITRIRPGAAAVSVSSTVSCIGADARLVSAMVMSSGTMNVTGIRFPGLIDTLTANFSVVLPDGGNIEGGRAQFGGEFFTTATANYRVGFLSNMTSATSLAVTPRYTGIVTGVTSRNWGDIAAYGNEIYAMVRSNESTRGLWKWTGSGDFTQLEQTTPYYWDGLGVTSTGDVYAVTNIDNNNSSGGQLYYRPVGGSFSSLGQTLRTYAAVEITGSDVYVVSQTTTTTIYKLISGNLSSIIGFGGHFFYDITFKDGFVYILARSGNNSRVIKNKVAYTYSADSADYTTIWVESFDGDGSYGQPSRITVASGVVYVAFNNQRPINDNDGSISGSVWRLTDSNTTNGASLTAITISGYDWVGLATTTDGKLYGIVPTGPNSGLYLLAYTS